MSANKITWTSHRACGQHGPDGERVTHENGVEISTWGKRGAPCEITDCTAPATVLERGPVNGRYGRRWQDRYWLCRPCFEARAREMHGGRWWQRHAEEPAR